MSDTPREQETNIAEALGGRRQPGSGSAAYAKSDVRTGDLYEGLQIECKQTKHKSIRIQSGWLDKITHEALAAGKEPALHIEIKGATTPPARQPWVVIPEHLFLELLDK